MSEDTARRLGAEALLAVFGHASMVGADDGYKYDVFAHCQQFISPAGIGSLYCDTPLTQPLRLPDVSDGTSWRFGIARCAFIDPVFETGYETAAQIQGRSVWICDEFGLR
jgi:hypothetical protein